MKKRLFFAVALIFAGVLLPFSYLYAVPRPQEFIRGDANGDTRLDIADVVTVAGYINGGRLVPPILDAADVNDDGRIDLADIVWLLGFLYQGGKQPRDPYPGLGIDKTPDTLGQPAPTPPVVDTTPPRTTIAPNPGTYQGPITISFTVNEANCKIYYILLPGGRFVSPQANPAKEYSVPFVIKEPGLTEIRFFAVDAQGNKEPYQIARYTIKEPEPADTTPPTITINPVKSPTNQNVTLSYNVSDNKSPRDKIVVTGNQSPYINAGTYNVTLTATDEAGNRATATVSFVIDKSGPAITISYPQAGALLSSTSVEVKGTVSDPSGIGRGSVLVNDNTAQVTGGNFSYPLTLTLVEGRTNLPIKVTARDALGNSAEKLISVSIHINKPPIAEAGPDREITLDPAKGFVEIILDGSGSSDPDGLADIAIYSWSINGTVINGKQVTYRLNKVGVYEAQLAVTDRAGLNSTDKAKCVIYIRGDANGDSQIDLADLVYLNNYLHNNGPALKPILLSGDYNADGRVDIGDLIKFSSEILAPPKIELQNVRMAASNPYLAYFDYVFDNTLQRTSFTESRNLQEGSNEVTIERVDPLSGRRATLTTLVTVDTQPPYLEGINPAPSATNVQPDTTVQLHIKDATSGVNNIKLYINNILAAPTITGTEQDYLVSYRPASPFTYGQTVNVAVNAADLKGNAITTGNAFSFSIAAAPGIEPPPLPTDGVIYIRASDNFPYLLNQPGKTYKLMEDIVAQGTAFVFKGDNITLDLNGHTIIYGYGGGSFRYGVVIPSSWVNHQGGQLTFYLDPYLDLADSYFGGAGNVTITSSAQGDQGKIIQGSSSGQGCHALSFRGGRVVINNIELRPKGPDSCGIQSIYSSLFKVHNCLVDSGVRVVTNRHYPGVDGIVAWNPAGDVEIYDNQVLNQPQWGIRLAGDTVPVNQLEQYRNSHKLLIHDNYIKSDIVTTNGLAIGIGLPFTEAYRNRIGKADQPSNSEGIQITAYYCKVYENQVYVLTNPNPEFPEKTSYGIALRWDNCHFSEVYNNTVVSYGDYYGNVNGNEYISRAAGLTYYAVGKDAKNKVYDNTFRAIRKHAKSWAAAIDLREAKSGSGELIQGNTFESNHYLMMVGWAGASDIGLYENTLRFIEPADGYNSRSAMCTLYYDMGVSDWQTGNKFYSVNNTFADNAFEAPAGLSNNRTLYSNYAKEQINFYEAHKIIVVVKDSAGRVVSGASVKAADQVGGITQATTDPEGKALLVLSEYKYNYVPGTNSVNDKVDVSRHTIKVEKDGITKDISIICDSAKTVEIVL